MTDKFLRDRISMVALWARNHGYPDVAKWMLAKDTKEAHKPRANKAKRADVAKDGKRVRGGKTFVNMENPDIEYRELGW